MLYLKVLLLWKIYCGYFYSICLFMIVVYLVLFIYSLFNMMNKGCVN